MAAVLVTDYRLNGYADWFLPSKDEMSAIYDARFSASAINSLLTESSVIGFWTSSEISAEDAWSFAPSFGFAPNPKRAGAFGGVIAVRAF